MQMLSFIPAVSKTVTRHKRLMTLLPNALLITVPLIQVQFSQHPPTLAHAMHLTLHTTTPPPKHTVFAADFKGPLQRVV